MGLIDVNFLVKEILFYINDKFYDESNAGLYYLLFQFSIAFDSILNTYITRVLVSFIKL